MKIHSLHIENFRGITELSLDFNGQNHLVIGGNGFGKSSIVDAIDFLLTGDVRRLRGSGFGSVKPETHFARLGIPPEHVKVRATVTLNGENNFTIERSLADASNIRSTDGSAAQMQAVKTFSELGQHIITRREILRFIAVQPKERADRIQELLDWSDVEDRRSSFVTIENSAKSQSQSASSQIKEIEKDLARRLEIKTFKESTALQKLNDLRNSIRLKEINELVADLLIEGIAKPEVTSPMSNARSACMRRNEIRRLSEDACLEISSSLASIFDKASGIPDGIERTLSTRKLVELGLAQIREGETACPLCDTAWEYEKLVDIMRKKLAISKEAAERISSIQDSVDRIRNTLSSTLELLDLFANCASGVGLLAETDAIRDLYKTLNASTHFEIPLTKEYITKYTSSDSLNAFLLDPAIQTTIDDITKKLTDVYGTASEEEATRTKIFEIYAKFISRADASTAASSKKVIYDRATRLRTLYEEARDSIVSIIYGKITSRFDDLYTTLHQTHAENFNSKLIPNEAGLDFLVKFHDKGEHPPHLVHSEGHQDSMGICLFIALGEYLAAGGSNFLILDDVITSIDSDHRHALAEMLRGELKNRQLIITTHDQTWAEQLKNRKRRIRAVLPRRYSHAMMWKTRSSSRGIHGHKGTR